MHHQGSLLARGGPLVRAGRFVAVLCVGCGASASLGDVVVTTFDGGAEGWVGPTGAFGMTTIEPTGGNPGANMRTQFNDFGITFFNQTNAGFIGDYTSDPSFTLSIDLKVEDISFIGNPQTRPWLVELRDYDNPPAPYPYVSVWYKFADVSPTTFGNWTTFSVHVDDTSAEALPAGWGGTGAEDGGANPILPPDRTFSDVLAGVDMVAFTTFEPGFFFVDVDFDLRIDNVTLETPATGIPAVSSWGAAVMMLLLLVGGTLVVGRGRVSGARC